MITVDYLAICLIFLWAWHGVKGKTMAVLAYSYSGFPVDFRWPVNTWLRVGVLEAQDGGAVGVA